MPGIRDFDGFPFGVPRVHNIPTYSKVNILIGAKQTCLVSATFNDGWMDGSQNEVDRSVTLRTHLTNNPLQQQSIPFQSKIILTQKVRTVTNLLLQTTFIFTILKKKVAEERECLAYSNLM